MYLAHKNNLKYDVWDNSQSNLETLNKIYQLALGIDNSIKDNEQRKQFFLKFIKFFGIDFVPTYSVVGSVASQEFIKTIGCIKNIIVRVIKKFLILNLIRKYSTSN